MIIQLIKLIFKAGTPQDKLRMFIIYYLCNPNLSTTELDQYLAQLRQANCDVDTIKYIKRYKSVSKMSIGGQSTASASAAIDFTSATK